MLPMIGVTFFANSALDSFLAAKLWPNVLCQIRGDERAHGHGARLSREASRG